MRGPYFVPPSTWTGPSYFLMISIFNFILLILSKAFDGVKDMPYSSKANIKRSPPLHIYGYIGAKTLIQA